nr:uncharacterized protein LOC126055245 isoform X8 [Helicoverpa armigera]
MEEMVDDPSEQYAEREEFEKQYYSLVAAARQLISNARKQASGNSIAEDGSLRCFLVETALHESPTSAHVRVSFGERLTQFARYPSPLLLKTLQRGEYVESSHSPQPRPRQVGATVTSWCNGSPRIAGSRGQDLLMRTGRAHAFFSSYMYLNLNSYLLNRITYIVILKNHYTYSHIIQSTLIIYSTC